MRRRPVAGVPWVRVPTPAQIGAATAMATMGALPLGVAPDPVETAGNDMTLPYAFASVGGATVGGALIGYVSSGDLRGIATGATLTAGLASMANAVPMIRRLDRRFIGVGFGIGGILAAGASLYLAATRDE